MKNKENKEIILTDEQWKMFKKASPHFQSSRHEYIRNAPKWLTEQTIRIYEDATGNTILNKDLSCANCVLRVYQVAGKLYFSELDRRNKLEEENKDGEERNEESHTRDSKKKKGNSGKSKGRSKQE